MEGGSQRTIWVFVLGILILAVAGLLAWYSGSFDFGKDKGGNPEGRIFLSLVPRDGTARQDIYYFDLSTRILREMTIQEEFENRFDKANVDYDAEKKRIAFVTQSEFNRDLMQLAIMDADGSGVKVITNSLTDKKDPDWSPNNSRIAFVSITWDRLREQKNRLWETELWDVYTTDLHGNETFITQGLNPKFITDSKLLVMKNDGLYIYDLSQEPFSAAPLWWMKDGTTYSGMKVGLSDDMSLLAWSNPQEGKMFIVQISSWEPVVMEQIDVLETHAFWPTFSPDGRFIAAQEIDWVNGGENPRLIIYDRVTKEKQRLLDLREFDPLKMWVNAWEL